MNFRTATSRKIKTLIKQGFTNEELCERFECTEEELEGHIRLLFKTGADGVLRDLCANRKKARPKLREEVGDLSGQSELESNSESEPEYVVVPTLVQESPTKPTLDELIQKEHALSNDVISLEVTHTELTGKHRVIIKRLREIDDELEGLERQTQSCRDRATQLDTQANEIVTEMNDISDQRHTKLAELDTVRKKIEEMSTVSIYVFSDGRIGAPDNPDFILEDEGYQVLKDELLTREECLDLRVRDIVTLARLKIISEKAAKFSLVFEDQSLESVYTMLFVE